MGSVCIETFYDCEAMPVLSDVRGPVDSFTLRDERKLLTSAIETGEIVPGSFRDCPIFEADELSIEQKRLRYDSLKVRELIKIIESAHGGGLTLRGRERVLFANHIVRQSVVVEAARRLIDELGEGTLSPRHAKLYGNLLDETQAELYPSVDRNTALYAANLALSGAEAADSEQAAVLAAYYPFLAEKSSQKVAELSQEKRDEWQAALKRKYAPAFSEVYERMQDQGLVLSNETLVEALRLFMVVTGFPMKPDVEDGWEVVRNEKISGFKVEPKLRQLHVGNRKAEITQPIFERLMIHEVAVHATRAQAGYALDSHVLANGLPGNAEVEEGTGILMESLWSGKPLDTIGRDHYRYMAVAYADGAYDGEKHTETETLTFITHVMSAQKLGGLFSQEQFKISRKLGFDHVKRAFRGMPDGKRMYSNLSYLSGKLKMIEFLSSSNMPAVSMLEYIQQGKFNPTNQEHLEFLEAVKKAAAGGEGAESEEL